jgi:GNAT superfamily N-acetyltransferase
MTDLLVRLYALPDLVPELERVRAQNISVRRGIAPEKHIVAAWVGATFNAHWQSETEVAFSSNPVTCWIAISEKRVVGFACWDATYRGFFGPTGVDETQRGKGIGKALLLACLHDMYAAGYAYGIIGAAGPIEWYKQTVGAVEIPDSTPGIYGGMLRQPEGEQHER